LWEFYAVARLIPQLQMITSGMNADLPPTSGLKGGINTWK
jgi:hypothetical protein